MPAPPKQKIQPIVTFTVTVFPDPLPEALPLPSDPPEFPLPELPLPLPWAKPIIETVSAWSRTIDFMSFMIEQFLSVWI
ncbi:MAG: hypothetical protein EOP07_15640 [Proteobacteria bacterium]|nr:MAG: hypothetical protein EOP07_15640 [Pseudomonadota bacterium]